MSCCCLFDTEGTGNCAVCVEAIVSPLWSLTVIGSAACCLFMHGIVVVMKWFVAPMSAIANDVLLLLVIGL